MLLISFEPIINEKSNIIILGTMPSVISLQKNEYYANPQNVFWKIIFSTFDKPLSNDYEIKKAILLKNNIALWDVILSCSREGSSDEKIINSVANNFITLFEQYKDIQKVYFNGKNAEKYYKKLVDIKKIRNDIQYFVLPSTSPANVVTINKKLNAWKDQIQFHFD
jgi:hypoxanthine-DNA glycosylase